MSSAKKFKIVVGSDHAGFDRKKQVCSALVDIADITDVGPEKKERVDYPVFAEKAARLFVKGGFDLGLLFCATGIGISIAANKVSGIRCAEVYNLFGAERAHQHNNANFLAFGQDIDYPVAPEQLIRAFLSTEYEGGRHQRRLDEITEIEKRN